MGEAAVEVVLDVKEALCELEELHVALGEGLERLRAVAVRAGGGAGERGGDAGRGEGGGAGAEEGGRDAGAEHGGRRAGEW